MDALMDIYGIPDKYQEMWRKVISEVTDPQMGKISRIMIHQYGKDIKCLYIVVSETKIKIYHNKVTFDRPDPQFLMDVKYDNDLSTTHYIGYMEPQLIHHRLKQLIGIIMEWMHISQYLSC